MKRLGCLGFGLLGLGVFALSLMSAAGSMDARVTSPSTAAPDDVIAHSLAASIQLYAEREGGVHRWASGVAVAGDNGHIFILTAAHLLMPQSAQTVYAIVPGTGVRVEAKILGIDEQADVAILAADLAEVAPVALQAGARLGDRVWVVSFPWGRRGTVVSGVVSQIVTGETETYLPVSGPVGLIDAAVSYGTSGAGVFDASTGRLVGLVRGYRTAKLALPGTPVQTLDIPIAGETTVIPTSVIRCLVARTDIDEQVKILLIATGSGTCADA